MCDTLHAATAYHMVNIYTSVASIVANFSSQLYSQGVPGWNKFKLQKSSDH